MLTFLKDFRSKKTKAEAAIDEWRRFKTPDNHDFEIKYIGPQSNKSIGIPTGCNELFTKELNISADEFDLVKSAATAFESYAGAKARDSKSDSSVTSQLIDRLLNVIAVFDLAFKTPEHYYAAFNIVANGSLSYASGDVDDLSSTPKPRQFPFMPPKSKQHPTYTVNPCPIKICRGDYAGTGYGSLLNDHGRIRHGFFCDGSTPRWQAVLKLNLLTPGPLMQQLSSSCRNLILASGSLSPISSLVAELNLFPPKVQCGKDKGKESEKPSDDDKLVYGRLQITPRPLEANHVIDLKKQLLAISVGHFCDGSSLTVNYKNYNQKGFLYKLGDAIATVIEGIPRGGVLVFLPSYSLLRKCVSFWDPSSQAPRWSGESLSDDQGRTIWNRFLSSKLTVIIEPSSGGQEEFEAKRNQYVKQIQNKGSCILLAVFRGKVGYSINN